MCIVVQRITMKTLIILLAIVLSCQSQTDDEVLQQWNDFQMKFEKTYKSPVERRHRFSIFSNNLRNIQAHNSLYEQGLKTYKQGITRFADWTSDEFLQYVNKYQIVPSKIGRKLFKVNSTLTVPDSIDWRSKDAVREVKDQGSCGSCWSFSATGAIEGAAALYKNLKVSFSEQYLIDCVGPGYGNMGCLGGRADGAFIYVELNGIDTEANYPYEGKDGTCKPAPQNAFRIDSYTDVDKNEESLKQAVGTVGPVSVGIQSTENLQHYSSGVLYDADCTEKLNHGVLVVGYGTEKGQDYWLIKNSWGPAWGDAGFFKLARNRGNNCGVSNMACFPVV